MSTATTSPHSDSTHHDHLEEEHRKYFTFFNLAIALIAITAIELVIIYIPVWAPIIWTSLIILSVLKFVGVIWWFMHLRWDRMLCTLLFLLGLGIATGTVIALMLLFQADPNGAPV